MKHKGIFITGTDTDAGKTIVAAGLLGLLRESGINAIPIKPIQTGCIQNENMLNAPDLDFSIKYSGVEYTDEEYEYMAPFKYKPACSPHLAGELADYYPSIKSIIPNVDYLLKKYELVIMEGAGGIMVPLNEDEMMLDLMKKMKLPVILVSRTGLGTINHTLMSLQILRNNGIDILGLIFNNTVPVNSENEFIIEDNIRTIAKFGKVEVLGVIDNFEKELEDSFDIIKDCFRKKVDIEKIVKYIR